MTSAPQPRPSESAPPRYAPDRPLPAYRFVPGQGWPHPIHDPDGHSFEGGGLPAPLPAWAPEGWASNQDYRFGVDLFNLAYWWEAHEVWEGLWQVTDKVGPPALFLQGLIQVSAALLKAFAGSGEGAARLSTSGEEKLMQVLRSGRCHEGRFFMGLDISGFLADVRRYFASYRARTADAGPGGPLPVLVLGEDA
ncbi:MAG: DUF309 domain-containing protein [Planctomycetota bacterium]